MPKKEPPSNSAEKERKARVTRRVAVGTIEKPHRPEIKTSVPLIQYTLREDSVDADTERVDKIHIRVRVVNALNMGLAQERAMTQKLVHTLHAENDKTYTNIFHREQVILAVDQISQTNAQMLLLSQMYQISEGGYKGDEHFRGTMFDKLDVSADTKDAWIQYLPSQTKGKLVEGSNERVVFDREDAVAIREALITHLMEQGSYYSFIRQYRDITALGAVGLFLKIFGASHDLRSKLGSVKAGVDFALYSAKKAARVSEQQPQRTESIRDRIHNQILPDVNRFEEFLTSLSVPTTERLSLQKLVASMQSAIVENYQSRPELVQKLAVLPFTSNIPVDEGREAIGEAEALQLMVNNVIDNSLKAGATQLQFSFRVEGDEAIVTIIDNGCGIPQNTLRRGFTLFDSSWPNALMSGLGIGMYARRVMLESWGGKFVIANTPYGGAQIEAHLLLQNKPHLVN